jgi:hypothetical protein
MATIMNPTPSLSPGTQAVLDYIRTHDWATYLESEKVLAPYIEVKEDGVIAMAGYANVVVWEGVGSAFVEIVNEVMRTLQVVRHPVPAMDYIIQGSHIALPLAESLRAYATPHWLPLCFRPIENCAAEQLRAQKARERWEGQAGIAPRTRANA